LVIDGEWASTKWLPNATAFANVTEKKKGVFIDEFPKRFEFTVRCSGVIIEIWRFY
jgi:hypothetical protein